MFSSAGGGYALKYFVKCQCKLFPVMTWVKISTRPRLSLAFQPWAQPPCRWNEGASYKRKTLNTAEQFICWEVSAFRSDIVHWWLLSGGDKERKFRAAGHFSGGAVLGNCVVKRECVMEECNHCPAPLGNARSEDIKWKGEMFHFGLSKENKN